MRSGLRIETRQSLRIQKSIEKAVKREYLQILVDSGRGKRLASAIELSDDGVGTWMTVDFGE